MERIIIKINVGEWDSPADEIASILRRLADRFEDGDAVGEWELTGSDGSNVGICRLDG